MGKLLLSLSCQKALSPARRMDRTQALVASRKAMEELRLEALSYETAAGRGVQAGLPRLTDTVPVRLRKPIHESWMRENRTSSLSGGRRQALRQLSAPLPTRQLGSRRRKRGDGEKGVAGRDHAGAGEGQDTALATLAAEPRACERGGQTFWPDMAAMIDPPRVLSGEPTAVTPHGGICGGESQQSLSYPARTDLCGGAQQ